jgi:hypothetical protein
MAIIGIGNFSREDLVKEIDSGARFVYYQYCVSVIIRSFQRDTDIYFIPAGKSSVTPGIPWSILTFFMGWWGIPWGFIYTPKAIAKNLSGGIDVTNQIRGQLGCTGTTEKPTVGSEVTKRFEG